MFWSFKLMLSENQVSPFNIFFHEHFCVCIYIPDLAAFSQVRRQKPELEDGILHLQFC